MDADRLLDGYLRFLVAFEPWAKWIARTLWFLFIFYATYGILETVMAGFIACLLAAVGATLVCAGLYAAWVILYNGSQGEPTTDCHGHLIGEDTEERW